MQELLSQAGWKAGLAPEESSAGLAVLRLRPAEVKLLTQASSFPLGRKSSLREAAPGHLGACCAAGGGEGCGLVGEGCR